MQYDMTSSAQIRATECDFAGRLRPDALFVHMQEAAEKHAALLHMSHQELLEKGLFFALVRLRIQVMRMPEFQDMIRIRTWAGVSNHFFCPRYHVISSEGGEPLCTASALWVMMDMETRRITSPARTSFVFPDTSSLDPPCPLPGRPATVSGEAETFCRIPAYSDTDINGHVNNARYISWMCDALGKDVFRDRFIRDLTVGYDKEIRDSAPLNLSLTRKAEEFSFHVLSGSGEKCFSASGILEASI